MRLHVGVFGAEEFLGAIDGKLLDLVGVLATPVVALAWVALGVFVGENRAHGFEDCLGNEVLRSGEQAGSIAAVIQDIWGELR